MAAERGEDIHPEERGESNGPNNKNKGKQRTTIERFGAAVVGRFASFFDRDLVEHAREEHPKEFDTGAGGEIESRIDQEKLDNQAGKNG